MKRAEFNDAYASCQLGSQSWLIITVSEHKTGFAESAKIVADENEEKMLAGWVKGVCTTCCVSLPHWSG